MPNSNLLVTVCLQNDFVKPIGRLDSLPNLLHIGYWESLRLNGPSFDMSPNQQLIDWAYAQTDAKLQILHIRDWHSEKDANQTSHLVQFGTHCIENTSGADFIFQEPKDHNKEIIIVNSFSLNDFANSNLEMSLKKFENKKMRVGIVGVWTEAKVIFLCYELASRYPEFEIAVCSALTASSNRTQHFLSLEQLKKVLGIKVFDSVGAFAEFLNGEPAKLKTVELLANNYLELNSNQMLSEVDQKLLRYLFRASSKVELNVLTGGFSGNRVLMASSIDLQGYEQAPTVIKLGPRDAMAKERVAFEKVEAIIGNSAPRIDEFVDYEERGALKYLYASMVGSSTRTLQKLITSNTDMSEIKRVLKHVFTYQLGKFYKSATPEIMDLLEYYGFNSKWASPVLENIKKISNFPVINGTIQTDWGAFKDPSLFYSHDLQKFKGRVTQIVSKSYVHGDLNGANILVDDNTNVWLIDFFHSHQGHVLRDLIKLENDILFIMTPIATGSELKLAFEISKTLINHEDLTKIPSFNLELFASHPAFLRTIEIVCYLRSFYKDILDTNRISTQYQIAALRYAIHTLSFDEASANQKNWALLHASLLSEVLAYRLESNLRLRVDWIKHENIKNEKVGLTILPGRRDQSRNIEEDFLTLSQADVNCLVCLVTEQELADYGVENYFKMAEKHKLQVYHLPIIDQSVSNILEIEKAISWIDAKLEKNQAVVIHCVGGLGRSGTLAACWLRTRGFSHQEAIKCVRDSRSTIAIENRKQEKFIEDFKIELI